MRANIWALQQLSVPPHSISGMQPRVSMSFRFRQRLINVFALTSSALSNKLVQLCWNWWKHTRLQLTAILADRCLYIFCITNIALHLSRIGSVNFWWSFLSVLDMTSLSCHRDASQEGRMQQALCNIPEMEVRSVWCNASWWRVMKNHGACSSANKQNVSVKSRAFRMSRKGTENSRSCFCNRGISLAYSLTNVLKAYLDV